jgi:hypothetical protein
LDKLELLVSNLTEAIEKKLNSSGPASSPRATRQQVEYDFGGQADELVSEGGSEPRDQQHQGRNGRQRSVREFLDQPGSRVARSGIQDYETLLAMPSPTSRLVEKVDVSLRRMAPYALATAGGNMTNYVKHQVKWKSSRNEHEALTFARVVDEMVNEGLNVTDSTAIEIACRRIASLQHADENPREGWHLAEVSGYGSSSTSLFPVDMLDQLLKRSTVVKKLHSSSSSNSKSDRSGHDRDGNRDSSDTRGKGAGAGKAAGSGKGGWVHDRSGSTGASTSQKGKRNSSAAKHQAADRE